MHSRAEVHFSHLLASLCDTHQLAALSGARAANEASVQQFAVGQPGGLFCICRVTFFLTESGKIDTSPFHLVIVRRT